MSRQHEDGQVAAAAAAQWVVKIPPPPSAPGLGHEKELLRGEMAFYTSAATAPDIPVPTVLHSELDPYAAGGPYLISTLCPGRPWNELSETIRDDERRRLRRELGAVVARLHTVAGTGFGYPAAPLGPPPATWRQTFTAMIHAVLDDADHCRVRQAPRDYPPERVARTRKQVTPQLLAAAREVETARA